MNNIGAKHRVPVTFFERAKRVFFHQGTPYMHFLFIIFLLGWVVSCEKNARPDGKGTNFGVAKLFDLWINVWFLLGEVMRL